MFDLNQLKSIKIGLASPEQIRSWGRGEVTRPETINYRSQKPEPDGLFCEKIFGPVKDYECYCGHYKKASFAGKVCEKCGVEVTLKAVRRERMGYINLAFPCAHIWYVKGSPSKMGLTLGVPPKELEEVIYFVSRIVINPGSSNILKKRMVLDETTGKAIFAQVLESELGIPSSADEDFIEPEEAKKGKNEGPIVRFEKGSTEFLKGVTYLKLLKDPRQPFDFLTVSRYISKHLGAKFGTGAEAIQELLQEIDLDKEIEAVAAILKDSKNDKNQKRIQAIKRLDVLESFKKSGIKPEWMVLTALPVIPPDLRPMMQLEGGRFATSDLNDLYRQVIIKNSRLKREIEEHAPDVILMNEKRMLQEAVDALIDNERRNKPTTSNSGNVLRSLSSTLKGKQGRFRQNLLGKRVDYSGRSVIAVGPELNMDECGLPREMAVQLFRPFIANYLIKNKDNSGMTINSQRQADELIARNDPRVYDAIEVIVKNHPVLLNRAPTLHRLGIQAFRPKLIDGKAIRLHPLVCPGFNADFDGDQMAVHVPLSRQAQAEALTFMLANKNILKPSDGQPICVPSQDMIYGNYYLTLEDDIKLNEDYATYYEHRGEPAMAEKFRSYNQYQGKVFSDPDTAIQAYQIGLISLRTRIFVPVLSLKKDWINEEKYASIRHSYLFTTVGKLIFNNIFPSDFPYVNFPYDFDAVKTGTASDKDLKKKLNKYLSDNLEETPMDIFVSAKDAYDAVIASGNFKAGDDFNAFKEYAKLQPCRAPIEKKGIKMMMDVIFRRYGAEKTANIMDAFKNQGFDYATKSGLTISLGDIQPLQGREELYEEGYKAVNEINENYKLGFYTDEERHNAVIDFWKQLKDGPIMKMLNKRMDDAPRNPMFMMMKSGARGSTDNYMQLIGMKGCMLDSTGRAIEVPVTDCYADGLSVSEYFTSTHGTRKNGSDTALKTADSGYLTRRLVDVSHNVVVRQIDCGCDHGLMVSALYNEDNNEKICSLKDRIIGRYSMRDIVHPETGEILVPANTYIDEPLADLVCESGITQVEIRSVLTCESKNGVCVHCYGRNLATGKIAEIGDTVGIMAAQSIGEPGTQLTLKNFHTGGVAGTKDITTGLPRVQELLEVRNPKAKDCTLITTIRGKVTKVEEIGLRTKFTVTNELEEKEFISYPSAVPCVKKDEEVKAGQALTKGHINPKDLLDCTDLTTVRNYLIKEVKKVYAGNGIDIADKHLEIIVRQMTNRLLIINSGDTKDLLPGMRITDVAFTEKNKTVLENGGNPAVGRPIIMGITKAALDTESFLSSASFQETTRVLTDAAIKGKTDDLVGLKENVMIGKLIPAGTGLKPLLPPEDETEIGVDGQAALASDPNIEIVKKDPFVSSL